MDSARSALAAAAVPADIEYEYRGEGTSTQEVKKCLEFAKQALA